MLTIILAAGDSIRLPNKCLMPQKSGKPIIESSLRLARTVDCPIAMVVKPGSLIKDWVGEEHVNYVYQSNAYGVVDAIQRAAVLSEDKLIVLFGDNVYDENEYIDSERSSYCTVRRVDNAELDRFCDDTGDYVHRGAIGDDHWKIAGHLVLDAVAVAQHDSNDFVQMLNDLHVEADYRGEYWHDVGTIESYKEYLKS